MGQTSQSQAELTARIGLILRELNQNIPLSDINLQQTVDIVQNHLGHIDPIKRPLWDPILSQIKNTRRIDQLDDEQQFQLYYLLQQASDGTLPE